MVLMMAKKHELVRRADRYAQRRGLVLADQLGFGIHGIVFVAESQTDPGRRAIKVHEREAPYCRERDVYLRLQEHRVSQNPRLPCPTVASIRRRILGD
jgi:hypothetical protein